MNTLQLMAANRAIHKPADRAPGGTPYHFEKPAAPPKFAATARPVRHASPANPAGEPGLDLFRMKSHPVAPASAPARPAATAPASGHPLLGTPVRLRPADQAVQGALHLDAVKVVRNDLSETDFEIVAARPAPGAAPAGLAPANWLARLAGTVRAWI